MENNNISLHDEHHERSYDLAVIITASIITFIVSAYCDVLEKIFEFTHKHERWQLDEFITVIIVLVLILTVFSVIRSRKLSALNRSIERKNDDLQKAFGEIKQLKGILPICVSCKKIRDDKGYWQQVESYIKSHTDAEFSHGLCPECMKKLYPDYC